jgi:hypothetical protein
MVVDADGKRKPKFKLARSATIHPRRDSKLVSFENHPSIFQLYNLSRAIFETGDPFKHEYLMFLKDHGKQYNQMRALKHFWDKNWRTVDGKKVIIKHPNNPYMK